MSRPTSWIHQALYGKGNTIATPEEAAAARNRYLEQHGDPDAVCAGCGAWLYTYDGNGRRTYDAFACERFWTEHERCNA